MTPDGEASGQSPARPVYVGDAPLERPPLQPDGHQPSMPEFDFAAIDDSPASAP